MWRALSRRQGLSDPALDRLLVSIPQADLASAEERARFWPSTPPQIETVLEIPSVDAPASDSPALPAPTDAGEAPATAPVEAQDP
jgi:hypothetical protein